LAAAGSTSPVHIHAYFLNDGLFEWAPKFSLKKRNLLYLEGGIVIVEIVFFGTAMGIVNFKFNYR
jgi:hypothetical protein